MSNLFRHCDTHFTFKTRTWNVSCLFLSSNSILYFQFYLTSHVKQTACQTYYEHYILYVITFSHLESTSSLHVLQYFVLVESYVIKWLASRQMKQLILVCQKQKGKICAFRPWNKTMIYTKAKDRNKIKMLQ